ncbi:MAG TPA: hypothetical protein GX704_01140 [Clostridiales bacterium]|jgi:hypothetical protein|nr:hypothetical protein [Clostridiales bacterium]
MKNSLKAAAALLAAVFLFAVIFTACADGGTSPANTTEAAATDVTTEAEVSTRLESGLVGQPDYGGYDYNIYLHGAHWVNDFKGEEQNGEVINDAQYERTAKVEELYNVKIKYQEYFSVDNRGGQKNVLKSVAAGSNDYDIAVMSGYSCCNAVTSNILRNLNTVPNLDLSMPWWDQYANSDFAFGDKLFMTTGDISTADNASTYCIYFNKKMAENFGLPNLYEKVDTMQWTIDNLKSYTVGVYEDTDGDGSGENDKDDTYAIYIWDDIMMGIVNASGIKCCEVNADGHIELTLYSDRFVSVFEQFTQFVYDKNITCAYQRNGYEADYGQIALREDRALFLLQHLGTITTLREMDTDFGVLPLPLFSEDQERYYNSSASWTSAFYTIPNNAFDDEGFARTGYILQALAYESLYTLTPAYYEITLKGKTTRDEESSAMLDLIFSTRSYDYGWYFEIGGYNEGIMNLLRSYSTNVASMYEKGLKKAEKLLDKINAAVDEISG